LQLEVGEDRRPTPVLLGYERCELLWCGRARHKAQSLESGDVIPVVDKTYGSTPKTRHHVVWSASRRDETHPRIACRRRKSRFRNSGNLVQDFMPMAAECNNAFESPALNLRSNQSRTIDEELNIVAYRTGQRVGPTPEMHKSCTQPGRAGEEESCNVGRRAICRNTDQ